MPVALKGSTSGEVTLTAPAVAGTTTITLPATTGNAVVDSATQTLTNKTINASQLVDASITAAKLDGSQSGSAPIYAARAWVNFNGTGTIAIVASGNVSSLVDGGVGTYTVNFTTALQDANYVVTQGSTANRIAYFSTYATGSFGVNTRETNTATLVDITPVLLSVFR